MHPLFLIRMHYWKTISDWLRSASICNSTLARAEPLAYIIIISRVPAFLEDGKAFLVVSHKASDHW